MAAKKNRDIKDAKDARRILVDRAFQKQSLKQYHVRFERMDVLICFIFLSKGTYSASRGRKKRRKLRRKMNESNCELFNDKFRSDTRDLQQNM